MAIHRFYKKSIVFLLLLLVSYGKINAEENFKIGNFEELQQKLKERVAINNANCGPICKSLKPIDKSFKKVYTSKEKTNILKLLDTALKTIGSKSPEDRQVVEEIKLQFFDVKSKVVQEPEQKNQRDNSLLKEIKDLENTNSYYMLFAIITSALAALSLLQMVKFQGRLVEQKKINTEQVKEIVYLKQNFLEKKENPKTDNQISKPLNPNPIAESAIDLDVNSKKIIKEYNYDNSAAFIKPNNLSLFYLSTPQTDGSFNDSNKTIAYIPTSSMYKFSLLSNEKAKFEFVNDSSSLKDALNYPDIYLLPVCRSENARNIQSLKITTTEPGIAELRDSKWIVSKKAVIRYD